MELVLLLIRLFLFGVFALAGIGKLLDLEGSEKAVKGFGVPDELAKPISIFLPVTEVVIAALLLFVGTSWVGAFLAFLLLLAFIVAMVVQMAQGKAPDCHCFGQIHSEPVGKWSLIRNIGFAILSFFLVAQGREDQGLALSQFSGDMLQAVFLLGILVLLGVAVFYLKKIFEQQVQIQRRIEVLELVSRDGAHVEREDIGSPAESLPIGAPFPDFELADTTGRQLRLSDFLNRKKPILFLFVSPECGPCNALYPEVKEWREALADKLAIVLVSSGSVSDNLAKFDAEANVLLQENRELAESVKAKWTPTAVYVNSEGRIASHPAAGDTAIRELVEKLTAEDLHKEHLFFSNTNGSGYPLKIGEKIPEFSMDDLSGKSVTQAAFLGKESLVVFFSLTCPHCVKMIEELKDWDNAKGEDDPNLVVFSDGDREAHEALGLTAPIILDSEYKFAGTIGMAGTPSAILVNEKGEIVTETGIGASNVWALIGKIRPNHND